MGPLVFTAWFRLRSGRLRLTRKKGPLGFLGGDFSCRALFPMLLACSVGMVCTCLDRCMCTSKQLNLGPMQYQIDVNMLWRTQHAAAVCIMATVIMNVVRSIIILENTYTC